MEKKAYETYTHIQKKYESSIIMVILSSDDGFKQHQQQLRCDRKQAEEKPTEAKKQPNSQ